jgi:hypothetical protein
MENHLAKSGYLLANKTKLGFSILIMTYAVKFNGSFTVYNNQKWPHKPCLVFKSRAINGLKLGPVCLVKPKILFH